MHRVQHQEPLILFRFVLASLRCFQTAYRSPFLWRYTALLFLGTQVEYVSRARRFYEPAQFLHPHAPFLRAICRVFLTVPFVFPRTAFEVPRRLISTLRRRVRVQQRLSEAILSAFGVIRLDHLETLAMQRMDRHRNWPARPPSSTSISPVPSESRENGIGEMTIVKGVSDVQHRMALPPTLCRIKQWSGRTSGP